MVLRHHFYCYSPSLQVLISFSIIVTFLKWYWHSFQNNSQKWPESWKITWKWICTNFEFDTWCNEIHDLKEKYAVLQKFILYSFKINAWPTQTKHKKLSPHEVLAHHTNKVVKTFTKESMPNQTPIHRWRFIFQHVNSHWHTCTHGSQ